MAATQSLSGAPPTATLGGATMPRFQDGTIDMRGLLRRLAEGVASETTDAGADRMRGGGNGRNGCRERRPPTCVGTLAPGVPEPGRGGFLPEDVLTRHQGVDGALAAAVAEACATGTGTRMVQGAARKMGMDGLSKGRASAMARDPGADVGELLSRGLSGVRRLGRRAHGTVAPRTPARSGPCTTSHARCPGTRANNVQERTDGEVRRRSRVVQALPSEAPPTRLVGAVLCGRDEGWSGSRCFSDEKISEPCEDEPKPEPPSEGRSGELGFVAEQATRASLGLADGMEAA